MDDIEELFGGLTQEPLPEPVRARIEAVLLGDAADARPMPARLRARLAATMSAGDLMGDLGGRPMPSGVREKLERRLLVRARKRVRIRALGAAAAVIALVISGLAIDGDLAPPPGGSFAGPLPTPAPHIALPEAPAPIAGVIGPEAPASFDAPGFSAGVVGGVDRGPAPPFMEGPVPAGAPVRGAAVNDRAAPGRPPPLHVGVITGDAAMQRGFEGYVRALNAGGGLLRREVRLVEVGPEAPAPQSVAATVNLSGASVASPDPPSWIRGPLLEGPDVAETSLIGGVFSTSSPPIRQARLIAGVMYPEPVERPTTAVIYRAGPEPFATTVPVALADALEARGVTPVTVATRTDGGPNVLIPGEVAFLSMPADAAAGWLAETRARGYRPDRGVAGIYSLIDGALAPALEAARATIISPYDGLDSQETLSSYFGGRDGFPIEQLHGWITAKDLAVAIWRAGLADSAADVQRALSRSLRGYASGFAPPYETRPGSNARTPEGVVHVVDDGRFVPRGSFLRDTG